MLALCSSPVAGLLIGSILDSDSGNPNRRGPLLAIDSEGDRGEERLNQTGADSSEDLPIRPAMLTAVQRNQRLALLLG